MHTPANIFSKSAHLMHTPREKLPKYGGIFKKYNNKKLPKNEEKPSNTGLSLCIKRYVLLWSE